MFPTAMVLFTFMYISPADHETIFKEFCRVQGFGGRLLIWDVIFPAGTDDHLIRYPVHVILPHKDIDTGYGVHLKGRQGSAHFVELAQKTGFHVISKKDEKAWFYLELKKSK